jgi:hypothetical protein
VLDRCELSHQALGRRRVEHVGVQPCDDTPQSRPQLGQIEHTFDISRRSERRQ